MIQQVEFSITAKRRGFHLITSEVVNKIGKLPEKGLLTLFIKHTSAGLTLNENADDTVRLDFESTFNQLIKENEPYYKHTFEGSDDMPAHIKSTLVGSSVTIPISNHQLNMGIWQGIYLCEFRNNGGNRKLVATIIS